MTVPNALLGFIKSPRGTINPRCNCGASRFHARHLRGGSHGRPCSDDLKSSTSLSHACITCGAAASLVVNLMRPHPHDPRVCLVDFSLAAVLTPILLMGVGIGVMLNVMLPSWLLTALLLLLLTALIAQSVHKGRALWLQENLLRQRHRQHHHHHYHVPDQHEQPRQPPPHVHHPPERQLKPRAARSEPAAVPGLLATAAPPGGASEPHLAIVVPAPTASTCPGLVPPLSRSSSSPRLFSGSTTPVAAITTTTSVDNRDEDLLAGSVKLPVAHPEQQQRRRPAAGTLAIAGAKAPGRTAVEMECGPQQPAVPYTTAGPLPGFPKPPATSEAPAGSPTARSTSWIAAASSLLSSLAAADSWQAFNELGAVEAPADILAPVEGGGDRDGSDPGSAASGTSTSSRGSESGEERDVDVIAMAVAGGDIGDWERELAGEVEPSSAPGLLVSGETKAAAASSREAPWHLGPDVDSTYMPIRASISGGGAAPDGALGGCQCSPLLESVTVTGGEGAAGAPASPVLASADARDGTLLATPDRREGHRPQPTSPTLRQPLDERTAVGAWGDGFDTDVGAFHGGDSDRRLGEVFVGLQEPLVLPPAMYGTAGDSQSPPPSSRGASAGRLWSRPQEPADDAACLMEPLLPRGTAGDAGPEAELCANIASGGVVAVAPCLPVSKLTHWLSKGRGRGHVVAGHAAAAAPATRASSHRRIPAGAVAALALAWAMHFSLQVLRNQVPRCSAPWWALAATQAVAMAALGAAGLVITAAGVATAAATVKVDSEVDARKATAAAGVPVPRPLSPPPLPEAAAVSTAAARAASGHSPGGQAAFGAKGDAAISKGVAAADDVRRLAMPAAASCRLQSDGPGPAPAQGLSSGPPGGGGGGGCLAIVLRCPVVVLSATCSAGLAGGLLGLGGGMVMGPLLLHLGELPQVTAATSGAMVLFSSSAALTQFALLGRLNMSYAAVFGAASAAASIVGGQLLGRAVRASGRPSLVVLTLAGVMAAGCGCVAVFGVQAALADLRGGGGWWPGALAALCGER